MVDLLIQNGATVNHEGDDGRTPLHFTVVNGKLQSNV